MADGQAATSAGWHRLVRPGPITLAFVAQAATRGPPSRTRTRPIRAKAESKASARPAWNSEFELLVNFEINQPQAEKGTVPAALRGRLGGGQCRENQCARSPSGSRWVGPGRSSGSRT